MAEQHYTTEQKLAEVVREIAMRRAVYRPLITSGRMTQDEADRRIGIMLSIAKDYGGRGE